MLPIIARRLGGHLLHLGASRRGEHQHDYLLEVLAQWRPSGMPTCVDVRRERGDEDFQLGETACAARRSSPMRTQAGLDQSRRRSTRSR
jgi:hypothetical protein